MRLDVISIEPYNPDWPRLFDEQALRIERCLSGWLSAPVEHIGSTSIPGMPAKPIVDMLALVADSESFGGALPKLSSIGWVHAPEPGDRDQRKWSVCFPSVEHRTHHLHVVEQGSNDWPQWLLFRDYLRTHPDAAQRYAALKEALAAADDRDRLRYRAGKAPLISQLMVEARAWRPETRRR